MRLEASTPQPYGSSLTRPIFLPDRFYHPPPLVAGAVSLDGPEAHHLIHVLRAKPGLDVILFSGDGGEHSARVVNVERSVIRLEAGARREVDRELPIAITIGVAMPKGDRQKWLVEKLTELGTARLTPLIAKRGVAQPSGDALKRFERAVVEASKQCGRNRLMEITEPVAIGDFLAQSPATVRLFAHPEGLPAATLGEVGNRESGFGSFGQPQVAVASALEDVIVQNEVLIAIGPEGGFTEAEVDQAREAGWRMVGLGKQILRTETAALAMVAAVSVLKSRR